MRPQLFRLPNAAYLDPLTVTAVVASRHPVHPEQVNVLVHFGHGHIQVLPVGSLQAGVEMTEDLVRLINEARALLDGNKAAAPPEGGTPPDA